MTPIAEKMHVTCHITDITMMSSLKSMRISNEWV